MNLSMGLEQWIQATTSIVAIVVAVGLGSFQLWMARRTERRKAEAYLAAASNAAYAGHSALTDVARRAQVGLGWSRREMGVASEASRLQAAEAAFASLPLHEAPDAAAVAAILQCREALQIVRGHLERFLSSGSDALERDFSAEVRSFEEGELSLLTLAARMFPGPLSVRVQRRIELAGYAKRVADRRKTGEQLRSTSSLEG